MNFATLALVLLGATASVAGMIVMFKSIVSSPEGYEDSQGFHYGRPAEELVVRSAVRHANFEHQTAA